MISLQLFVLLPSKCSRVFLFYVGVLGTSDVKFLTPHSNIDNKVINEPWRILFMNNNERKTERQIKSTQSEIPETNCLPSTVMTLCIRYLHLPHLFTLNLILRNWLIFMDFYSSRPLLAMRKNVPFQTIDCRKHLQSMFQIHSLYLALTY